MILSPEAEIAQFLRRLKYILFAGLIGWVVAAGADPDPVRAGTGAGLAG